MCNLISAVARCDALCGRTQPDEEKTATGRRTTEPSSLFASERLGRRKGVVTLSVSLLKLWVPSDQGFLVKAERFVCLDKTFLFQGKQKMDFTQLQAKRFVLLIVLLYSF